MVWILQNWKHEWKNCAAAHSVESRRAGEHSPAHPCYLKPSFAKL